jgi:hypothetical protein
MPEFDRLSARLREEEKKRQGALDRAASARAKLSRLEGQRARIVRSRGAGGGREREALADLKREIGAARQELIDARAAAAGHRKAGIDLAVALDTVVDPRKAIGRWSDDFPILLLPYRLETRFAVRPGANGPAHQLWVRIYPDACAVDTFEEGLSEGELRSARRYWQEIWRAGGHEPLERGAWRALVEGHGSGRSGWIVEHFKPNNPGDAPARTNASDVILVIPTDALPAPSRGTALAAYWSAVWRADGKAAATNAALAQLRAAVGGAGPAAALLDEYLPFNLADRPAAPLLPKDVAVRVAFLELPANVPAAPTSWNRPPQAVAMPDRFLLIATSGSDRIEQLGKVIPSPLAVGPDPAAPREESLRAENGDVKVPDEMLWMFDFERAVEWGMGFVLPLSAEQFQRGIDRLVVVGVRLTADADQGRREVEALLTHHRDGRSGIAILPQGTPTNNTEEGAAGYSRLEDADAAFATRGRGATFTATGDDATKPDGQWLSEMLGVDPASIHAIPHGDGTDQLEARAMAGALWPATWGYFLGAMMHPIVSEDDVERSRSFFTNYVSGRGGVAAIRIGSQPYGILPATAYSRMRWLTPGDHGVLPRPEILRSAVDPFLSRLYVLLKRLDGTWSAMAGGLSFVGKKSGDPHQILLDVLGLHPSSVEFSSRYAESVEQVHHTANLFGRGFDAQGLRDALRMSEGLALLASLGHVGPGWPDILNKLFLGSVDNLSGPLIDDRPLSETEAVRVWTTDDMNYLQKLAASARVSLDLVRTHDGYLDGRPPTALLYLLLRHGLLLSYHHAALRFYASAGLRNGAQLEEMRREPAYIHVDPARKGSESRWAPLIAREPSITGSPDRSVAEHVRDMLGVRPEADGLAEVITAIERLENVPTARLERLLAEHLDCCSYRFDAWLLGLVRFQLSEMRAPREREGGARRGLYVGGYAWLEDVRAKAMALETAAVPREIAGEFTKDGEPAPLHDRSNGGYVHAPSLNHAITAAVLRSGYLANAGPANAETLAVDLSSERVRLALSMLDGMRTGQSLGALLGYRLQRGLHDRYAIAEVDQHIEQIRQFYPLQANRLQSTADPDAPIESVEARNVIDGLALVEQARKHLDAAGHAVYPFGDSRLPAQMPQASKDAISQELDALLEIHDALGDVALAESVHQAVQGNFDRAAGTLDAFTRGNYPPDPDVVRTPVSGIGITHRVGLHLEPGLPAPAAGTRPRAVAEPALDSWLASVLPPLDRVVCTVVWRAPNNTERSRVVSLAELGYRPIDLLYSLHTDGEQAMRELDDRVLKCVIDADAPRADARLTIRYMERPAGRFSVFELMPLVAQLRALLLRARPLRATDVSLENESAPRQDEQVFADRERVARVLEELKAFKGQIDPLLAQIRPLIADPAVNRAALLAGIDGFIDDAIRLFARGAEFGLTEGGWGFAYDWRRTHVTALLDQVVELVTRWTEKLAECQSWLDAETNLPAGASDAERIEALRRGEMVVSTVAEASPIAVAALRTKVKQKRDSLKARRDQFTGAINAVGGSASAALAAIAALMPVGAFDLKSFSLADAERRVFTFAADLERALSALAKQRETRAVAGKAALDAHDAAARPAEKVAALERGARALLGEEFRLIPEFALGDRQGGEWQQALAAGKSAGGAPAELFTYLIQQAGVDFPVDEWLAGVARVRGPMRAWEQAAIMAAGFLRPEPELAAMQIPYRPGDRWLALQIPDDYDLDGSRLLYTAHYAVPFDSARRQCGLLLDEWTEVIPGGRAEEDAAGVVARDQRETTGIAFQLDRPNSEAPQAMLLVTPATWNGHWQWNDVVDAIVETLALAKKRAVEPRHIAQTPLARLLPSTVMAAARQGISISTPLAINNNVYAALRRD